MSRLPHLICAMLFVIVGLDPTIQFLFVPPLDSRLRGNDSLGGKYSSFLFL